MSQCRILYGIEKYINTEQTALFEQENKNNYLFGFTNNYIKIKIPFNTKYCQTQKKSKITRDRSKWCNES